MNKKKDKKKHRNNKRIRGDLTCFEGTKLEKQAFCLSKGALIENSLIELRNLGKDAFGMRMQCAAKMSGVYQPISEISIQIVINHLKTIKTAPNAYKFADCFFASYNGHKHLLEINPPKCKTTNVKKAFKHGAKDCLKAFDVYFRPINSRMSDEIVETICDNNIVGKYNDIKVALSFVIEFLCNLHYKNMPPKISDTVFKNAKSIDLSLENYYEYDNIMQMYNLNENKNTRYSGISQECATYLICCKHK